MDFEFVFIHLTFVNNGTVYPQLKCTHFLRQNDTARKCVENGKSGTLFIIK